MDVVTVDDDGQGRLRVEWRRPATAPGFSLIFLAFLLFAVPVWLLLFRRTIVIVDPLERPLPFARINSLAIKRGVLTSQLAGRLARITGTMVVHPSDG